MGIIARFFRFLSGAPAPVAKIQTRTQRTSQAKREVELARRRLDAKRAAREGCWAKTQIASLPED